MQQLSCGRASLHLPHAYACIKPDSLNRQYCRGHYSALVNVSSRHRRADAASTPSAPAKLRPFPERRPTRLRAASIPGLSTRTLEEVPPLEPRPATLRGPLDKQYITGLIWLQRGHILKAAFALVVCTLCNLASPIITGILFETLAGRQPITVYPKFLAIMAALYTVEPLLTRVYIRNACAAGEKVLASLRQELFRTLLMQKIDFFDRHPPTELTSLLSVEMDNLRSFVFNNVSRDRGLRAIMEATGSVVVLFVLSWRLGPILALVIMASAFAASLYKSQTAQLGRAQSESLSNLVGVANQAFANITTVRSFAGEALERERFGDYVADSYRAGLGFARAKAVLESVNRGAIHLSLLALYGLGGYLVSRGLMPLRVLLSAIGFTFSLVFATQGVIQTFSEMRRAAAAIQRMQDITGGSDPDPSMEEALPPGAWWETANNCPLPGQPRPLQTAEFAQDGDAALEAAKRGALELRDVWFSYPLRPNVPVLRGFNLTLRKGTVTALVGRSGAGKSTVAALLSRFYQPDRGGIYLGDSEAPEFTRGAWARAVALVSQEPVLFAGSIADNIAYGLMTQSSPDEIENAARLANAHEFIQELPDGYNTLVGERGALLSGGQRQRIALARALLKDSPIIILDEATSALDVKSERLVQQAIENLVAGRTVLVIAHRLSTVQAADQIVVIDSGRVAELGSHSELVASGGLYAELVNSQSLTLSASM